MTDTRYQVAVNNYYLFPKIFHLNLIYLLQGGFSGGAHLFPFRTQKLSPPAPMVLLTRESRPPPVFILFLKNLYHCDKGFFVLYISQLFQPNSNRYMSSDLYSLYFTIITRFIPQHQSIPGSLNKFFSIQLKSKELIK